MCAFIHFASISFQSYDIRYQPDNNKKTPLIVQLNLKVAIKCNIDIECIDMTRNKKQEYQQQQRCLYWLCFLIFAGFFFLAQSTKWKTQKIQRKQQQNQFACTNIRSIADK